MSADRPLAVLVSALGVAVCLFVSAVGGLEGVIAVYLAVAVFCLWRRSELSVVMLLAYLPITRMSRELSTSGIPLVRTAVLLLVAWLLIADERRTATRGLRAFVPAGCFLFVFVAAASRSSASLSGSLTIVGAAAVGLLACAAGLRSLSRPGALAVVAGAYITLGFVLDETTVGGRSLLLAANPNLAAASVAACTPFLLSGLRVSYRSAGARKVATSVIVVLLGVAALSIGRTGSRGGGLAFVLAVMAWFLFDIREGGSSYRGLRKLRLLRLQIALVAGASLILVFGLFVSEQRVNSTDISNLSGRAEIYDVSIQTFLSSPLVGVGEGSRVQVDERERANHSTYLLVLGQSGLVGAAAFVYVLARGWPRRGLGAMGTGIRASMVALLVGSLSGDLLLQSFFWFTLGLGLAARGYQRSAANALMKRSDRSTSDTSTRHRP